MQPEVIGPYQVLGVLGRGAFGTVFRVRDGEGRELALKWLQGLTEDDAESMMRFSREVDIASSLRHPNLVRVLAAGAFEGVPYCTMEVIEGPSLRTVIQERPPGPTTVEWRRRVHALGTPLFDALQYVHNQRVVHRDLKPDNVFVAGGTIPMLGDFGLAVLQSSFARRSREGTLSGTVAYMAPELFMGLDADRRTDMYALGVMLLEFICGRLPFPSTDSSAILGAILTDGPTRLMELEASAPAELQDVLSRMTSAAPEDRYFSLADAYEEWVGGLALWLGEPLEARSLSLEVAACDLLEPGFVGRADTLERLSAAFREKQPLVVIRGEAGAGKSRLLSQWVRTLPSGAAVLAGACAMPPAAPLQALRSTLTDLVRGAGEAADRELVSDALSPAGETASRTDLDQAPGTERLQLHEAVRRLLTQRAESSSGLVLVVDDAQWLDAASLPLLRHLVTTSPGHFLVVLAMRPESDPMDVEALRLELAPLAREEQLQLARSALGLGNRDLPEELSDRLEAASGGNPLGLLSVLDGLFREGVLRRRPGRWDWNAEAAVRWEAGAADESGGRLHEAVQRRLHRLAPEESRLLGTAAMGRGSLDLDALATVSGLSPRTTLDAVERLAALRLLQESKDGRSSRYGFVNQTIQQAARDGLSESSRLELHRRWADLLEERLARPDAPVELVFDLLEHAEAIGEPARFAPFLRTVAEQYAAAHDYAAAAATCARLIELQQANHSVEPALRVRLGELYEDAGQYEAALAVFGDLLEAETDVRIRLSLRFSRARVRFHRGHYEAAVQEWMSTLDELGIGLPSGLIGKLRTGLALAGTLHPALGSSRLPRETDMVNAAVEACQNILVANFMLTEASKELPMFAAATIMQLAQRTGRDDLMARAEGIFSFPFASHIPPRVTQARQYLARSEDALTRINNPRLQVELSYMEVILLTFIGDVLRAVELAERTIALSRASGDLNGFLFSVNIAFLPLSILGQFPRASSLLQEAAPLVETLRHARISASLRTQHAGLHTLCGGYEEAWQYFSTPADYERPTPFDLMMDGYQRGMLYLRQGRLADAEELLWDAFDESIRLSHGAMLSIWIGQHLAMAMVALITIKPRAGRNRRRAADLHRVAATCRRFAGSNPMLLGWSDTVQAECAALDGANQRALRLYGRAIRDTESLGHRYPAAWFQECLARHLHRQASPEAPSAMGRAADAWDAISAVAHARELRRLEAEWTSEAPSGGRPRTQASEVVPSENP